MKMQRNGLAAAGTALGLMLLCGPAGAEPAAAAPVAINIDRQPIGDAINAFAAQTGLQILLRVESMPRDVTAPRVSGTLTPRAALKQLLEGSGLRYEYVDERTVAIMPAKSRSQSREDASSFSLARVDGAAVEPGVQPEDRRVDSEGAGDEIVVTGTHIRGAYGKGAISPVLTFTREDIERAGVITLGELSRLIPQAFSENSYDGIGIGGQATGRSTSDGSLSSATAMRTTFNLRGLGTNSTLVLVDGRRLSRSGNINGQVGYDLAGIPVSAVERIEVLTDGASATYGADALAGVINIILRKDYSGTAATLSYENTFSSDTAVKTLGLSHSMALGRLGLRIEGSLMDRNAFAATDRPFSATDYWTRLGGTSDPRVAFSAFGAQGGIYSPAGNLPGLDRPDAAIPVGSNGQGLTVADFANAGPAPAVLDKAPYTEIISPQRRASASVGATYDVSPRLRLHADARWSRTTTDISGLPVDLSAGGLPLPPGMGGNPFPQTIIVSKYYWELGDIYGRKEAITDNAAVVLAATGRLFGDWRYDVSAGWTVAHLDNEDAVLPNVDPAKYFDALASGQLSLLYDSRTQDPNPPGLLRSLIYDGTDADRTDAYDYLAMVEGPVWQLPAGAARIAFGVERVKDRARTEQALIEPGFINFSFLGDFERTLDSAFSELRVPLISDRQSIPLVHELSLSGAIRHDRYSDIGGDSSPSAGVLYAPLSWLSLRARRSDSYRAPTLRDLYRPVTTGSNSNTAGFIDPVTGQAVTGTMTTRLGGNPGLKPETGRSTTFGVAIDVPLPSLAGLSFSVDYSDYALRNQISTNLSLQEWATYAPERLIRDTTGRVTGLDVRAFNFSELLVRTLDYQMRYRRSFAFGNVDLRLAATEYRRWDSIRAPGAAAVTSLYLRPDRMSWSGYWDRGPWGIGVSGFYSAASYTTAAQTQVRYSSAIEWNTQLAYDFGPAARSGGWPGQALRGTKLSLTVNNILDREPPHVQGRAGFAVTDPRMARYILTLGKEF